MTNLDQLMATDWAEQMQPVSENITEMGQFLRDELAAGKHYLPAGDAIFRAFAEPLANVKVLITGQDPYPTPGHAMGLSFSVAPRVQPIPRSLQNIFTELRDDLGISPSHTGDLTPWARQGVFMLNRVLTVRPGEPASHRGKGWEAITDQAIHALIARHQPLVAILWGRDAQSLQPMLGDVPCVRSPHPSPMSASRGFFGSRPFSNANSLLERLGAEPVNWELGSGGTAMTPAQER